MGGRIHDVDVHSTVRSTTYVTAAGGGLWKTTNHGFLWSPVFDATDENSFGDVVIFTANPNVLWAGTGEQNKRQSSTWDGGVFRSIDAGAT
jgi:hypothetical protein